MPVICQSEDANNNYCFRRKITALQSYRQTCVTGTRRIGMECSCVLRRRLDSIVFIVLFVVSAVHKFDFRLVIRQKPNKWGPDTVLETYIFDMLCVFSVQV